MELDADSYWSIYIGVSNAELLTWESFREATYGLDYGKIGWLQFNDSLCGDKDH